jgi:hypothetical protein
MLPDACSPAGLADSGMSMTFESTTQASIHAKPARTLAERRLVAQMRRRLAIGADVRREKTNAVRKAIELDDYENDLKLSVALDRMLGDLS